MVDLVDMEFIFVSVKILKTVDLASLEGLLNLLPLSAEGFADFAEILAFGDKKQNWGTFKGRRQSNSIFSDK